MSRGHDRERAVADKLREDDWVVTRAAGSLGDYDLHCSKLGHATMLVEVKSTAAGPYHDFGPQARSVLLFAAERAGAEPWLAWWPPRGKLRWIAAAEWPMSRREAA